MKKLYGLIGYPLSHSFSKKYFARKFQRERIIDCTYELFEIDSIDQVGDLFSQSNLQGFNVTIPYKNEIMGFMDDFDHSAKKVGAVNVVKINHNGKKTGFNSDYYGFKNSLENWMPNMKGYRALILGTGGASKAVVTVLQDLSIPFLKISRDAAKGDLTYDGLRTGPDVLQEHPLIINTTPLGMSPNIDAMPDVDFTKINEKFLLYDLIYNPAETRFMSEGRKMGARIKNGLEMLELQAEKSWEIWNS